VCAGILFNEVCHNFSGKFGKKGRKESSNSIFDRKVVRKKFCGPDSIFNGKVSGRTIKNGETIGVIRQAFLETLSKKIYRDS
jgi:hypothetical protein